MEVVDNICERLSLNDLEKVKFIKDVSDKIKMKPGHIGLIFVSLATLFVVFEYGAYWIAFAVGFLYPAYMSFKALETPDPADDKQWLTYWIVFSCLNVFDKVISIVLSMIPMFSFIKILLYVWLFHPKKRGATVVYEKVLRPILKKYEGEIDNKLEQLGKAVQDATPVLGNMVQDARKEVVNRAVDQALSSRKYS